MKRDPHFLPPRQYVIYAVTRRLLDETALNSSKFAMRVAELYLQRTAPDVRTVPFKWGEGDALFAAERANAQILRRYMDGAVKVLPCDLEDAWLLALPEPYRSNCEAELARRRGRLSVVMPTTDASADALALADLMRAAGALCAEFGQALADGRVDAAEREVMFNRGDAVIAAVLQFRAALQGEMHAQHR